MRLRPSLLAVALLGCANAWASSAPNREPSVIEARAFAEHWLALVDAGQIEESWGSFDSSQCKEDCDPDTARLRSLLAALGPLQRRVLKDQKRERADLRFVFRAQYERGPATETVVVRVAPEGWTVSRYELRADLQNQLVSPEGTARVFLDAYLTQQPTARHFTGAKPLYWMMSTRLRRVLIEAEGCQADWRRQQPHGSLARAPFADCCLFASSPSGIPTSFELGPQEILPDRRVHVFVDFERENERWRDALILKREGKDFVVDDFLFARDHAASRLLSGSFMGCRGPKWVGVQ